jgi:acetoin utilization protein AcuB
MKSPVTTVAPNDTLHVADGIMSLGGLRHLPVLSKGELVGILTHRDILRAPGLLAPVLGLAADTRAALRALRAEEAMTATVVTIGAQASLPDAAAQLLKHQVGCLPVLEHGGLVGIVTTSDLLRAMAGPCDAEADRAGATVNGMAPAASRVPRREA